MGNGNKNRRRLTGKQRAFIDAWFANDFNGTEAARTAGYGNGESTDNYLAMQASRTIRKDKVQREIKRRWAAHGMTAEEVTARWVEQARASIEDFFDFRGKLPILDLEKAKERCKLHLVQKMYWTAMGPRLELYSAKDALDSIAKSLGMFNQKREIDITTAGESLNARFTDEERANSMVSLLDAFRTRLLRPDGDGADAMAPEE